MTNDNNTYLESLAAEIERNLDEALHLDRVLATAEAARSAPGAELPPGLEPLAAEITRIFDEIDSADRIHDSVPVVSGKLACCWRMWA
jgi:hypothetical protein